MRTSVLLSVLCLALAGVAFAQEAVTPTSKIMLWNGKDFDGLKMHVSKPDQPMPWTVKDGVIDCTGVPSGYIRTEAAYRDYKLHVEWRWSGEPGNNGILVHRSGDDMVWPKSIEIQLMNQNAGDFFVIEGTEFKEHIAVNAAAEKPTRRVPKQGESAEKPIGEWNAADIVCKGDTIVVKINGELKNTATECNVQSGQICLQSEGKPIQFRNVYIEPLD